MLGIRPNAGREEIELAYKGRRSQYHPDRYAQADEATQRWANACMQDVNVAYQALTSGASTCGGSPDPAASRKREAPGGAAGQERTAGISIAEAMRSSRAASTPMDRVYLAPNIPLKKLHNALDSYSACLGPDDVLALLDDTIFGSGKDGALVTAKELWLKEAFTPPVRHALPIPGLATNGTALLVEGRRIHKFNMVDDHELALLVTALTDAFRSMKTNGHRGAASAPRQAGGPALDALIRHHAEPYISQIFDLANEQLHGIRHQQGAGGVEHAAMMGLLLHVANASGAVASAVEQRTGQRPPEADRALLACDAVRLEILVYLFAFCMHSLVVELGRDVDAACDDLDDLYTALILPVVATIQASRIVMPDDVKPVLRGSDLLLALQPRIEQHLTALQDPDLDLDSHVFVCLSDAIALKAYRSAGAPVSSRTWADALLGACRPRDAGAVVRNASQGMRAYLATFGC